MRWQSWGIVLSVLVHGSIAFGIARIPRDAGKKSGLVAVVQKKKDDKKKDEHPKEDEPPPPPPKPIEAPKPKIKQPAVENTPPPPPPANAPPPVAAAHPALAALPDLGLAMAGGPGGAGIAVPVVRAGDPTAAAAPRPDASASKPRAKDECPEPEVKPKSVPLAQGGIIAAAQSAGIEGKLRLELQIDEGGNITSARVMTGLGGAIDDAALAAARRAKVSPITKCGRPVAGRLVYAMTIRNPD